VLSEASIVILNAIGASSVGAYSNCTVSAANLADGVYVLILYDASGAFISKKKL
jgi:hypothetical protein